MKVGQMVSFLSGEAFDADGKVKEWT